MAKSPFYYRAITFFCYRAKGLKKHGGLKGPIDLNVKGYKVLEAKGHKILSVKGLKVLEINGHKVFSINGLKVLEVNGHKVFSINGLKVLEVSWPQSLFFQ